MKKEKRIHTQIFWYSYPDHETFCLYIYQVIYSFDDVLTTTLNRGTQHNTERNTTHTEATQKLRWRKVNTKEQYKTEKDQEFGDSADILQR